LEDVFFVLFYTLEVVKHNISIKEPVAILYLTEIIFQRQTVDGADILMNKRGQVVIKKKKQSNLTEEQMLQCWSN